MDWTGVKRFFAGRWWGEVSLGRLFWHDMALVGTMINVVTSLASLLMLAADQPFWLAMAVFFSPLPYNLFLFLCVWRRSETSDRNTAFAARTAAAMWLVAATLI